MVARVNGGVYTGIYPFGQVGTVLEHIAGVQEDLIPPVRRGKSDSSIAMCNPFTVRKGYTKYAVR